MNPLRLFQNFFCQEGGIQKHISYWPSFTYYFFGQWSDLLQEPLLLQAYQKAMREARQLAATEAGPRKNLLKSQVSEN